MNRDREILEDKQAEFAKLLSPTRRDEIAISRSADPLDNVQCDAELEIAIEHLDRDFAAPRSVRAALGRIDDGTYGSCLRCEKVINAKRLAAVPWTSFCITCQEAMDRLRNATADGPADFLSDTA
jgi:DnaK suppressor protein